MTRRAPGTRRRFLADVTPLRESRRFRHLFVGEMLTFLGRRIAEVAIPLQVFLLTDSTLLVGVLGGVQFASLLVISPLGGALTDATDRRRLLLTGQLLLGATAGGLALNAGSANPAVWPLFVLGGINSALSTIDLPARMVAIPALLPRAQLPAAFALNQMMGQVAAVGGPALAGVLIAQFNLTVTYLVELAVFLGAAWATVGVGRLRPEEGGRAVSLASIVEGLRYLREHRLIQSTFVIDLNAMIFGMPRALFPVLGTQILGASAFAVGLLHAAPGVGAFLASVTSGWVGSARRQGRIVILMVMLWGAGIALFGVVPYLPLALFLLAVAGGADAISAIFRNTILQLNVPDALRGRLSSVHLLVVNGGPKLGDLESGAVASVTSVGFSVVSGGLASIIGALAVARFIPRLWRYHASEASH